jgi:predicted nucleotidyltransferase
MLTQEKARDILRRELPNLRDNFGVRSIGLFGSFAKGEQTEDSDIDILIEFEKPIGLKFVELAEYLEKVFGRQVDVLTPAGIKGIRIKKIAQEIERGIVYV